MMANIFIALVMSIGRPRVKRSRSMCTESSMFQRLRHHLIRWKLKVSPCVAYRLNTCLNSPVRQLSELLAQVKDEQSYIVVRERIHRNTAESTNGRVKWWSIFQMGVLVGEGIFQVWWLKRFFEVG